jgi:hypothetical protein
VQAAGYGAALAPLPLATPAARGNVVTYPHAGLSEWYRNGPLGLEQGFTVLRSAAVERAAPFTVSLALDGDLRAALAGGGHSLALLGPSGRTVLRYAGLRASDARGHALRAWLQLRSRRVLLRVDTRGAVFPVRIDPFVQQVEALEGSASGKFGASLAVSGDGNTALVGAPEQAGPEAKEGVAFVYVRSGSTWVEQAELSTPAGLSGGAFGSSVGLSGDGNTAVIGSPGSRAGAGLVWFFSRSKGKWSQTQRARNNTTEREHEFGSEVALAAEGTTAVVEANDAERRPTDVIFTRSGGTWTAQQRLEGFPGGLALSSDGSTLLTGGAVFVRSGSVWNKQQKLFGKEQVGESDFGDSVAVSGDGNTALIGGPEDNACGTCVHSSVGGAWMFTRSGEKWTQQGPKLTASGGHTEGHFGESVALSADGNAALIGAPGNGQVEPTETGSAFLFTRSGATWTQQEQFSTAGTRWQEEVENGPPELGTTVALSAGGRTAVVGASDFEQGWASVFARPATVTSVSPGTGPHSGGTSVTIGGANLSEATSVKFGSTAAKGLSMNSSSSITATAPAGAGVVDVTVSVPDTGTTATTPADQYTYANPPQLGRCVPSARRMGEFKNAACTKPGHGKGKANWLAGPGPKPGFTLTLGAPALQSTGAGNVLITCTIGKGEGEYTGAQTLKLTKLSFSGCAESPRKAGVSSDCQATGSPNGEIVGDELAGEVAFIHAARKKAKVGVDLQGAGGVLANFECGGASTGTGKGTGAGTPRELEGSVIGTLKTLNAMSAGNALTYQVSAGHQVPEHFEGALPDTLTTLVGLEKTPEPTTLSASGELADEEAIEVNSVV